MADINDLKAVNDRYGHEVGDQVLFSVAQALRRAPGMWFRLGGDEFVGFVSGKIPERQMGILVDSICQQVQKGEITSSPMAGNGFEKIVPQIAIGFARGMRKADANMYKDKGGKKNGK